MTQKNMPENLTRSCKGSKNMVSEKHPAYSLSLPANSSNSVARVIVPVDTPIEDIETLIDYLEIIKRHELWVNFGIKRERLGQESPKPTRKLRFSNSPRTQDVFKFHKRREKKTRRRFLCRKSRKLPG